MNSEQVTAFLQEHWYFVTLAVGVVFLIGAIRNWNWLCDPTGKPDSHRYGRDSRRVIFFLLGIVLIVVSVWSLLSVVLPDLRLQAGLFPGFQRRKSG